MYSEQADLLEPTLLRPPNQRGTEICGCGPAYAISEPSYLSPRTVVSLHLLCRWSRWSLAG